MSDIIAIVDFDQNLYGLTNLTNPTVIGSLSDIGNVDTFNLQNGSVLVYSTSTNKWTSTTHLNLQDMEAGEY